MKREPFNVFYVPLLGGCVILTIASVLMGDWVASLVASAGLGIFAGALDGVCAQAQDVRPKSVLPHMRARLGGLLERENIQAVEVQRCDGGGSG